MTTPEPTVIERIHRIGIDLSVLLELNEAAMHRTHDEIMANDDDTTRVLQLFSWDNVVALRRARQVLADAVDEYDKRKRAADPDQFGSLIAVYRLDCGCTVESGPGEIRLTIGQQWPCPGDADAGLQDVVAVTFIDPSKGALPRARVPAGISGNIAAIAASAAMGRVVGACRRDMLRSMITVLECPTCRSTYVRCDYDDETKAHQHVCESCGTAGAVADNPDEFTAR